MNLNTILTIKFENDHIWMKFDQIMAIFRKNAYKKGVFEKLSWKP